MVVASVLIPYASYHEHLVQRAVLSATQQSVRCEVITVEDKEARGAGWARNQGIIQATAPFCIFLDADDTLDPQFTEECLSAYQQGHYVYTDFLQDGAHKVTSDCATWFNGLWHPITTLFPTQAVRYLGGFDESLPGGEDRDFYLKAIAAGLCGIRVPKPLMNYTGDGQRSQEWLHNPAYIRIRQAIDKRYVSMGCGCSKASFPVVMNNQQEGDVMATVLYPPRKEFGLASGRIYDRPLHQGQEMWVDPRDVVASPDLWQIKTDLVKITPDVDTVLKLAQAAHDPV